MSATTIFKVLHPETAAQMAPELSQGSTMAREEALAVGRYMEALASGIQTGTLYGSVAEASGVQATSAITIASGSGLTQVWINGVLFSTTWATSDTVTAAALVTLINASADVKVANVVTAANVAGVITLTAVDKAAAGNAITVAVSGTGVTVNGTAVQRPGVQASGTVTYVTPSGAQTISVNGVSISCGTAGATATLTAAASAAAINASANALVSGIVYATSALGVVTITAVDGGLQGNAVTTTATGTGATADQARLTGGVEAGTSASGTITIASGSGTITGIINGISVAITWATDDTTSAALLAAAINSSTNALVRGIVVATSAAGVVTVTSVIKAKTANAITLAATGTGATASGARLTAGANPQYNRAASGVSTVFTTYTLT